MWPKPIRHSQIQTHFLGRGHWRSRTADAFDIGFLLVKKAGDKIAGGA
jgi:hypothetical protein